MQYKMILFRLEREMMIAHAMTGNEVRVSACCETANESF